MNVALLAPLGLIALAALALPILIHLMRRLELRTTEFAALRWIAERISPQRRLRVERPWLLAIRLLLLALLAVLLARPVVEADRGPSSAWVVVVPGVDRGAARAAVGDSVAQWHWLAPGFPSTEAEATTVPVLVASLLRELDADLPTTSAITVVVPADMAGLDGERLHLRHAVDWRVVPGRMAAVATPSAKPVRIAVRATADDAPSLVYVRAAVAAWNIAESERYRLDVQPPSAPIEDDVQWLIWLGAPRPAAVSAWIENGGVALLAHHAVANGDVLWRDEHGDALAWRETSGSGRIIALPGGLTPKELPALLDADFPARLLAALRGPPPSPMRASANAAKPTRAPRRGFGHVHRAGVGAAARSLAHRADRRTLPARADRRDTQASQGGRMTADERIGDLRRIASRRRAAIVVALVTPLWLALILAGFRAQGPDAAIVLFVLGLLASGTLAWRAFRAVDARWIARRLDATSPAMEDSAALLMTPPDSLSPLARLQQARLRERLGRLQTDLRPAWPWRAIAVGAGMAIAICGVALVSVRRDESRNDSTVAASADAAATSTAITFTELAIQAPAYTQVPIRTEAALDAKAPAGSRLRWRLRFSPVPSGARLQFHDGTRAELIRDGDEWRGEHALAASTLYRIVLDGVPPPSGDRLHRLDAVADLPPDVRVIEPEKTLTLLDSQQKTWNLAFEASDDYGIAHAELTLTLAQGTGENIAFKEQSIELAGEAIDADRGYRHLRYHHALDLAALGIAKGDDVIVRLAVADNREPAPNTTRSASFILRWPVDPSKESAGLDGVVQKTMPAYFRSQRQIIIDSEALIADKPTLDDAHFTTRSDAIGVDQKILRLRYGQFLGEESEGQAEHAPDTAAAPAADSQGGALADVHEAHERASASTAPTRFGTEGNTVAEYGHVHDIAEAATLLDPETKATLKSALDEMWQAELNLRQGKPYEALPYEHRALDFVKQVQQSTRIYLARVGLELPTPDEARRLSGERKNLTDRVGTLVPRDAGDASLVRLWQTLQTRGTPDWAAAETWITAHQSTLPDALGVLAALDRARADVQCETCRDELENSLWSLVPVPTAGSAPRTAPDAEGRAYLDAIQAKASDATPAQVPR